MDGWMGAVVFLNSKGNQICTICTDEKVREREKIDFDLI